jgi:hypothetical protein
MNNRVARLHYGFLYDAVNGLVDNIVWNGNMIDELERTWKETLVA